MAIFNPGYQCHRMSLLPSLGPVIESFNVEVAIPLEVTYLLLVEEAEEGEMPAWASLSLVGNSMSV